MSSTLLRTDALSAYLLIAIGMVAAIACAASITYLHQEVAARTITSRAARRYPILVSAFITCMTAAVLAANLGLLWVAIEATTIVTAFLVGHRRSRESVEAAWKYVILCSAGIAIAFLGLVCLYTAAVGAGAHGLQALDWPWLHTHARQLNPDLVRLATGLILLGFGTKAGLAPMHAWLPDAHSQAPAPVSALMSGVLLSVAFYAIWRTITITTLTVGPGYVRALLTIASLLSLTVAGLLLVGQRDYKRMLAYSSIEHMGLVAFGTAIGGPIAMAAVLLHVLGHGLTKAVAFCTAGRILQHTGTSRITAATGLAARLPTAAALFGLAVVALLGLPPFSLFASELGIARAGFAAGYGWAVAAAVTLLVLAFVAIARHTATMLLGQPADAGAPVVTAAPARPIGWLPLLAGLAAAALLGIWLGPLSHLISNAAAIAAGP
jgi:hydrogenase-4 component F